MSKPDSQTAHLNAIRNALTQELPSASGAPRKQWCARCADPQRPVDAYFAEAFYHAGQTGDFVSIILPETVRCGWCRSITRLRPRNVKPQEHATFYGAAA